MQQKLRTDEGRWWLRHIYTGGRSVAITSPAIVSFPVPALYLSNVICDQTAGSSLCKLRCDNGMQLWGNWAALISVVMFSFLYWSVDLGQLLVLRQFSAVQDIIRSDFKRRLNWRPAVRISSPVTLRINQLNKWLGLTMFSCWKVCRYYIHAPVQCSTVDRSSLLLAFASLITVCKIACGHHQRCRGPLPHFCSFQSFMCFEKGPPLWREERSGYTGHPPSTGGPLERTLTHSIGWPALRTSAHTHTQRVVYKCNFSISCFLPPT